MFTGVRREQNGHTEYIDAVFFKRNVYLFNKAYDM